MSDSSDFFFGNKLCENCVRGEQSLAYCNECKRHLCDVCHGEHKKMIDTMNHNIAENPKAEEIRSKHQCLDHKGMPLKYYCITCRKPICEYCQLNGKCHGHKFHVIHDIRKEIGVLLEEARKKMREFEGHKEHITVVLEQNKAAITRCESEVENTIDQLIKQLQEQKNCFLEQLREQSEKDQERDKGELEIVERDLDKIKKNVENTENLLESDNVARVMVDRDSTMANLTAASQYTWNPSKVTALDWQLKSRPLDEFACEFGQLIPKPNEDNIIVGFKQQEVPDVGKQNEFMITVNPAVQYEGYDVTEEVEVKITQQPYQKQARDETVHLVISKKSANPNVWSVTYFLRKHGDLTINVSVCGVAAAGSPFKLQTVEKKELEVGTKVVRGPDWKWGNQDGGEGSIGMVVKVKKDGWVNVKWEKRKDAGDYRWGASDCYDLKLSKK